MSWTCGRCATVNSADASHCEVCGGAQGNTTPAVTDSGGESFPAPSLLPPSARSGGAPQVSGSPVASGDHAGSSGDHAPPATTAPPPARRSGPGAVVLVLGLVVAGLLAGVISYLVFAGGDDSTTASPRSGGLPENDRESRTREADDGGPAIVTEPDRPEDDAAVVTVTTPESTTIPGSGSRGANLFAGEAVLRSSPSLGATEVARYRGRDGMDLEVLEEAGPGGWYKVRADDGSEGYLFGAFVLPPSSGFCVGETLSKQAPVVYVNGAVTSAEKSGSKVLSTFQSDGLWEVVLPGGQTGETFEAISVLECGPGGAQQ